MNKTFDGNKLLIPLNAQGRREIMQGVSGGLGGNISWDRLIDSLRLVREFKPGEVVTRLEVDERGIRYYTTDRVDSDGD